MNSKDFRLRRTSFMIYHFLIIIVMTIDENSLKRFNNVRIHLLIFLSYLNKRF